MKVIKEKNLNNPIILIKLMQNNTLLVVDSTTTIRYFDIKELALLSGFKAKINHKRYKTNVVAFSDDRQYFASMSSNCREARLINLKSKKTVAKVDRHQGEVSCVGIDPSSRYMFSCGDDGKSFALDVKTGKLVFTLPYHADTINDIEFSANSNWVATASYDRKISLFNLATMTPTQKLKAHAAPVMKLKFLKKNRLISTDKNSSAIVWDIYTGKVLERLQGIHDDVTQITTAEDDKFLFLGTNLGYVLVYDLNTYELLSKQFIKLTSSITALNYDESNNSLIIGTENGDLLFFNIYEGEDKLKTLLKERKFNEITRMSTLNPILAYTKVYELVSNLWENSLKKAKVCLQKGDKKSALLILNDFKHIPAKNSIIQKVLLEYTEFEKFTKVVKEGKYALAYGLVKIHPMYKESEVYKVLEAKWKKAFTLAQKYSLQSKGMDTAKEILAPYRGVSEKTRLIQELYTKGKIYKRFREAVTQKDFKLLFELIKQNPFLKEFPEYDSIMRYADTLYIKSRQLMEQGEIHAAIKMLRILSNFTDFEEEVVDLMLEMESRQLFSNAVRDKNLDVIYELLSKYEELLDTEDGKLYSERWNESFENAKKYAAEGDVNGLKKEMETYLKLNSKTMSIATLFSWCYISQLENALRGNRVQKDIEKGIKNYFLYFGEQEQIFKFFDLFKRYYPDSKLNLEHLHKSSLNLWRPAMIVESILD